MGTAANDAVILLGGSTSPRSPEAMVTWMQNLTPAPAAYLRKMKNMSHSLSWVCCYACVWLWVCDCFCYCVYLDSQSCLHIHASASPMFRWFAAPARWIQEWWKTCLHYFPLRLVLRERGHTFCFESCRNINMYCGNIRCLRTQTQPSNGVQWSFRLYVASVFHQKTVAYCFCRFIELFTRAHLSITDVSRERGTFILIYFKL